MKLVLSFTYLYVIEWFLQNTVIQIGCKRLPKIDYNCLISISFSISINAKTSPFAECASLNSVSNI